MFLGFPWGSFGKVSTCNSGDLGLISGLERSPGEGKGYALQYFGLENSMDYIVHGVTKSWKPLSLSWGKGPDLIGIGRSILLWALSISRCSSCLSHECKSLIALHSGHYSGLLWQWATLRKEVMTFLGQRGDLPLLAIKMVKHPSSNFLSYNNPLHIQGPSRNTCIVPLGSGGQVVWTSCWHSGYCMYCE